MTQQQLADLCGVHRSFVISIEKGRQNLSLSSLLRIATALGVLPSDLMRGYTRQVMRRLNG